MSKVNFIALGPMPENEVTTLTIGEATIEIQKTVPYEKILDGVQWAVNFIVDDRPFISAPLYRIITDLAVLRVFTNFDFSSFDDFTIQPHEIYEIYDILANFDVLEQVIMNIDDKQHVFIFSTIRETCDSLIAYRNSAMGIVDSISAKAKDTNENVTEALSYLEDPTKLEHAQKIINMMAPPNAE